MKNFQKVAAVSALATAVALVSGHVIKESKQDEDVKVLVNDGGSVTQVLTVEADDSQVGIGTASPSTKLEVVGGVRLDGKNSSDGLLLDLAGSGDYRIRESGTTDLVQFGDSSGSAITHNISSGLVSFAGSGISLTGASSTIRLFGADTTSGSIEFPDESNTFASGGAAIKAVGTGSSRRLTFLGNGAASDYIGFFTQSGKFRITDTPGTYDTNTGAMTIYGQPGLVVNNRSTASSARDNIVFYDGQGAGGEVNGRIECTATTNTCSYTTSSDARQKHKHEDFPGLGMAMKMRPSRYERRSAPGVKEIGLVAQELYRVFPQAVHVGGGDAGKEPWEIDYSKLTPVLLKAIQELKHENNALRARLDAAGL